MVSHEVGGIVLKSEKLPASEWLIQLGERLRQIAVNAEQIIQRWRGSSAPTVSADPTRTTEGGGYDDYRSD